MTILVTGGAGFVGSHFVWAARESGRQVVVLDDLSGGPAPKLPPDVPLVVGDIGDRAAVRHALLEHRATAIAHFAGKIQVGESVQKPELYFDVNLIRGLGLLEAAREAGVYHFIFSSTAAVYGVPNEVPISEKAPRAPVNPYGATKLAFEHALEGYEVAHGFRWAAPRYFNAAGARPDGSLRESHEPETHLIPLVIDAALGLRPPLTIYGEDYPTPDGTCVRDYIHVSDLASAHLAALVQLEAGRSVGPVNLGTGRGFSVRQVIDAAAEVLKRPVPFTVGPRRAGDPAVLVADPSRARDVLGWSPVRSELNVMIEDAARARMT
ncbi:MAG TPA: UDP-glucose 4-epimerase GalE [Polyangiaceae bacterium]|jgi:UDP-glucose-4-epimerase GalE|nr:UDP-glucose 4-epimerase GalE [Polyangiaceae bacterium]